MTEDYAPHDFELRSKTQSPFRCLFRCRAIIAMTKFLPFGAWWLGLAGLFGATGGGCPCCGAPICAASGWSVGVLSAIFAWCAVNWKKVIKQ